MNRAPECRGPRCRRRSGAPGVVEERHDPATCPRAIAARRREEDRREMWTTALLAAGLLFAFGLAVALGLGAGR